MKSHMLETVPFCGSHIKHPLEGYKQNCLVRPEWYKPIEIKRGAQSQHESQLILQSLTEKTLSSQIYRGASKEVSKRAKHLRKLLSKTAVTRTPWSSLEYEIFKKGDATCDMRIWKRTRERKEQLVLAFDLQRYLAKSNIPSAFTSVSTKGQFLSFIAAALSRIVQIIDSKITVVIDGFGTAMMSSSTMMEISDSSPSSTMMKKTTDSVLEKHSDAIEKHGFNHPYIPRYGLKIDTIDRARKVLMSEIDIKDRDVGHKENGKENGKEAERRKKAEGKARRTAYESMHLISATPSIQQCVSGESFLGFLSGIGISDAEVPDDLWAPAKKKEAILTPVSVIAETILTSAAKNILTEFEMKTRRKEFSRKKIEEKMALLRKEMTEKIQKALAGLRKIFEGAPESVESYVKRMRQAGGRNITVLIAMNGSTKKKASAGEVASLNDTVYVAAGWGIKSRVERNILKSLIEKSADEDAKVKSEDADVAANRADNKLSSARLKDLLLDDLQQLCDLTEESDVNIADEHHYEEAKRYYEKVFKVKQERHMKEYVLSNPDFTPRTDRQFCGVGGGYDAPDSRERQIRVRAWTEKDLDKNDPFLVNKNEFAMKAFRIVTDNQRTVMNETYERVFEVINTFVDDILRPAPASTSEAEPVPKQEPLSNSEHKAKPQSAGQTQIPTTESQEQGGTNNKNILTAVLIIGTVIFLC